MAEPAKKKRRVKPAETVRERAQKSNTQPTPQRIRKAAGTVAKPVRTAQTAGKKEFHLPLPDNRLGKLLKKRVRFMPKFFSQAWAEVRQVTWPNARETFKLTLAVFVFAIVFGGLIWVVDYGLENIFRRILIE